MTERRSDDPNYVENRQRAYHHAYKRLEQVGRDFLKTRGEPYVWPFAMDDDGFTHQEILVTNQTVVGMKRVVDSLYSDIFDVGEENSIPFLRQSAMRAVDMEEGKQYDINM